MLFCDQSLAYLQQRNQTYFIQQLTEADTESHSQIYTGYGSPPGNLTSSLSPLSCWLDECVNTAKKPAQGIHGSTKVRGGYVSFLMAVLCLRCSMFAQDTLLNTERNLMISHRFATLRFNFIKRKVP